MAAGCTAPSIFVIAGCVLVSVVAIFTLEFCLRLYACVEEEGHEGPLLGRLRQARSPGMLVDMLAILPFFAQAFLNYVLDLRFLRIFRLLRLLKLACYTDATRTLAKVIGREWPVMAAAAFIMVLLVVLTASLGYVFEHDAQPDKFENIPQSIYWAVITLASVGYGDITPVTPAGRAVTIVLALIGIGIFAIPAALLSSAFSDQLHKERDALRQELFEMLGDGVLSEEEAEILNREVKRLHLSAEDVEVLMQEARRPGRWPPTCPSCRCTSSLPSQRMRSSISSRSCATSASSASWPTTRGSPRWHGPMAGSPRPNGGPGRASAARPPTTAARPRSRPDHRLLAPSMPSSLRVAPSTTAAMAATPQTPNRCGRLSSFSGPSRPAAGPD